MVINKINNAYGKLLFKITKEKAVFHLNVNCEVWRITNKKQTSKVIKYDIVCAYINHSIWNGLEDIPPHNNTEHIQIKSVLSRIDTILSWKNKCNPARLDLIYNINATKDWLIAKTKSNLNCKVLYPIKNAIRKVINKYKKTSKKRKVMMPEKCLSNNCWCCAIFFTL